MHSKLQLASLSSMTTYGSKSMLEGPTSVLEGAKGFTDDFFHVESVSFPQLKERKKVVPLQ